MNWARMLASYGQNNRKGWKGAACSLDESLRIAFSAASIRPTIQLLLNSINREEQNGLGSHMLAYITGTVDQELLLRNEYLAAENRILKAQIKGRLLLSEADKVTLAEIAHRLGRKALEEVTGAAMPDTILGWYRKLIANKFDGSRFRGSAGRPRVEEETERLVVQMAKENPTWGYDRIVGGLANLGQRLQVEIYGRIRRAVLVEGRSQRSVAREFGLARVTVRKMLGYSIPPGYQRKEPAKRPKLGPWVGVIDAILEEDKTKPAKQRHTAKRIFDRLRAEHAFPGGYTIVKDYVRAAALRHREMFVPLTHAAGTAQADFGEAVVSVDGEERKAHYFAIELPHSDDCFVMAFPAETTEAFLEGHVQAFAYFGGVPTSILYDNTKLAVARILGDGTR